jgi:hypothetical protein
MTDENGRLNWKSRLLWLVVGLFSFIGTVVGAGVVTPMTEAGLSWATNRVIHIGTTVNDLKTNQDATKSDITGIHTKVDSLVGDVSTIKSLVTQDIQDGQANAKASKDRSDVAAKWRETATGQIKSLHSGLQNVQSGLTNLESRVQKLEGTTTHAIGVMATTQEDIAYGKCCTMHNCRSFDSPCKKPKHEE